MRPSTRNRLLAARSTRCSSGASSTVGNSGLTLRRRRRLRRKNDRLLPGLLRRLLTLRLLRGRYDLDSGRLRRGVADRDSQQQRCEVERSRLRCMSGSFEEHH